MEDRFLQQLKKGVLELLVLDAICEGSTYGYELLTKLKVGSGERFVLKEGTLYPILYRLEDDGMIQSSWMAGEGRKAPKKIYTATEKGQQERLRRTDAWHSFSESVDAFIGRNGNEKGNEY